MEIMLIRHGKTESNMRGAFTGKRDEGLCEHAAKDLESKAYPAVEVLISSPMRRCKETAKLIYPSMDPIIIDDLRERDFGEFEGKTHDEIIAIPGFSEWGMNEAGMIFPGGEEYRPFVNRCVGAFKRILETTSKFKMKSTAVICHGGVIMAVLSELAEPKREYFSWACQNGGGYILSYNRDTGGLTVKGSIFE